MRPARQRNNAKFRALEEELAVMTLIEYMGGQIALNRHFSFFGNRTFPGIVSLIVTDVASGSQMLGHCRRSWL